MTSGVYPRKPGHKVGTKPMFDADDVAEIRAYRDKGRSTRWISSYFYVSIETIRRVLNGTGAYKDYK
jgi:hypothetical protein